jgi:hypothetical protein
MDFLDSVPRSSAQWQILIFLYPLEKRWRRERNIHLQAMRNSLPLPFCVFFLPIIACAEGNLIQNGSFENSSGYAPNETFGFPNDVLVTSPGLPAGSGSLDHWNVNHGSGWGEFYWYWGAVANQPSHDGSRFVNLTSGSGQTTLQGVSQTFNVVAGKTHTVTYFSRARATGAQVSAVIGLAAGSATGDLAQTSAPDSVWRPFTFSFVPDTNTTATLTFRQASWTAGLDNGVFLDSISVTANDPPLVVAGVSSTAALNYAASASSTDLINSGQSTLASAAISPSNAAFPGAGIHDGNYSNTLAHNTFFQTGAHFPAIATFTLDTTVNFSGYDISNITSLMGWATVSQVHANQTYAIEVSTVNDPGFTALAVVSYKPFPDSDGAAYESKVEITHNSGRIASGVDAIRFNFLNPVGLDGVPPGQGQFEGTVVREIDVIGTPTVAGPTPLTISFPPSRYIVQRSGANTGAVTLSGTCGTSTDTVEARAVVMSGSNSGTTTPWQMIDPSPTGGTFSGDLAGVPAGGWYQLEARPVVSGVPGEAAVIAKFGVGDIFVTAGQSNSANYGSPAYTPTDDRVITRSSLAGPQWQLAQDPQPLADGVGGSAWSRLGDLLAAELDIPIGFITVGVGSTQASQWLPGTSNYNSRLRTAIQSFPAAGFRAVLWHQGESDSIANVDAATHASRLASIISQSRSDAGWTIPWYISEASFHPDTHLSQEEKVTAGQRAAIHADPAVFFGPTTDAFHLEDSSGGKLSDGVHFNAAGLADHAVQWLAILTETTSATPRNADFEENRTPSITELSPLADGATAITNTSDLDSPSVIAWRILSSAGTTAANGSNGLLNPGTGTYSAAVDSINSGVLPGMSGRHVATLSGGTAGNHFLHSTRARILPQHLVTLTVAIGVRDSSASFGNAALEILADGIPVASSTFSKATLDTIKGSNSAGSFTNASISFTTDASETGSKALAIRIGKAGGTGTVLDFDNVRLTSAPLTGFQQWQILHFGSITSPDADPAGDFDRDGLPTGLEYFMGTLPKIPNAAPATTMVNITGREFVRYVLPLDPSVTETGATLHYSFNLGTWFPAADSLDNSVDETRTSTSWTLDIATDTHPRAFFRAGIAGDL